MKPTNARSYTKHGGQKLNAWDEHPKHLNLNYFLFFVRQFFGKKAGALEIKCFRIKFLWEIPGGSCHGSANAEFYWWLRGANLHHWTRNIDGIDTAP